MSTSTSLLAYADVQEILDRALESEKGIRVTLPTAGKATYFRQRAYKFRSLDREQNKRVYPADNPMHGKSVYDVLVVVGEKGALEVEVRRNTLDGLVIEEL